MGRNTKTNSTEISRTPNTSEPKKCTHNRLHISATTAKANPSTAYITFPIHKLSFFRQKNFKPKRMRTESMQWKKSRTTQKFLPESHYNENYQDYQKAYSKVEHFKHPYLATFNPSPLHVIQGKKYSNYQNEFFDKSPRKSRKTEGSDGEDEVYFQPTKAPQF